MSNKKTYNTTLSRVVKGSTGRIRFVFSIVKDEDGDDDCFLSTIEIAGRAIADGLEIQLSLQSTSTTGQNWRLTSPEDIVINDKNGKQLEIRLQDVVLKTNGGEPMVMAAFGRQGESVVTTENWYVDLCRVLECRC